MREYTLTMRYILVEGGAPLNYSIKLVANDMLSCKDEAIGLVKKIYPASIAIWVFAITATGPEVK